MEEQTGRIAVGKGKFAIVSQEDFWYLTYLCEWSLSSDGYARGHGGRKDGKQFHLYLHIEVAKRMGLTTTDLLDHKDGNRLNCCRCNLRVATHGQNRANSRIGRNNTSGHKGVCWHKRNSMWSAKITVNYQQIHLGYYHDIEKAKAAYAWASRYYFKEFASP